MKLLLLNGNTDPAITERLAAAARAMCADEIVPATACFGARYIATRAASAIAAHAVLDALAELVGADNPAGFDAAIIACSATPGWRRRGRCCPSRFSGWRMPPSRRPCGSHRAWRC